MASPNIYIPVNFQQVFDMVKQLPSKEKAQLFAMLQKEQEETWSIPEEHKKIVRRRVKKYNEHPEQLVDWKKAQKMIKANG